MIYVIVLIVAVLLGLYVIGLGRGTFNIPDALTGRSGTVLSGMMIVLCALGLGALWFMYQTPTPMAAFGQFSRLLIAKADVALILWHRELPYNTDNGLRITSMNADSGMVVYHVFLPATSTGDLLKMAAISEEELKKSACSDPEFEGKLKIGLTVQVGYVMGDEWGAPPFLVTPSMCGF